MHVIHGTSLNGRGMAWKRIYGSQKLKCITCKRSCNTISRTTYWSDFLVHITVKAVKELCKVPDVHNTYLHGWDSSREDVVLLSSAW